MKGQLSLFVIIGIIVVLVTAVSLTLLTPTYKPQPASVFDIARAQLQQCWAYQDRKALLLVGSQGGWAMPSDGVDSGLAVTAYTLVDGKDAIPDKNTLELQLAGAINALRSDCLINVSGVTHTPTNGGIRTIITDNTVMVLSYGGGTLAAGGTQEDEGEWTDTIKTRFGTLVDRAHTFAAQLATDPTTFDVLPIANEGFNVTMVSVGMRDWLVMFSDRQDEPSIFWLAGTIPDVDLARAGVGPHVVQPMPVTVAAGSSISGIIQADDPQGGTLHFQSLSPLLQINPNNGAYRISTTDFDVGKHVALIDISDDAGHSVVVPLEVTVA